MQTRNTTPKCVSNTILERIATHAHWPPGPSFFHSQLRGSLPSLHQLFPFSLPFPSIPLGIIPFYLSSDLSLSSYLHFINLPNFLLVN
jgi:hypothetical protein